jgi:hypothetical protein
VSTTFSELSESEATGRIADIFAEIRHFYGVPYVSSLQRHLATLPGVLEWAWAAVRPAFASGTLQETAWRLAREAELAPLPKLSRAAMHLLGVDDAGIRRIYDVCLGFETVAPLNMAMGGTVRALLQGERARGQGFWREGWRPPPSLPAPPATLHPDALGADARAVLMQLAADMDGETFVPGLYRQLAHWPGFLAHAATELRPLLTDTTTVEACQALRQRIAEMVPGLLAGLPEPPPPPGGMPARHVLAAIETYQGTSPQMICFGRLLREALPE